MHDEGNVKIDEIIVSDGFGEDPQWLNSQEAYTRIVYRLLGSDYYTRYDWIQNGRANAVALADILRYYPRWLCRIVVAIGRFFST